MSMNEPTPRTDEIVGNMKGHVIPLELHQLLIALERELAAAKAELARALDKEKQSPAYLSMLEAMLEVKAQRDALRARVAELERELSEADERNREATYRIDSNAELYFKERDKAETFAKRVAEMEQDKAREAGT